MGTRLGALDVGTDVVAADLLLVQQSGVDNQVVASELPLPFNYIGGLITSNDAIDLDHDIAITAGAARAADDSTNLKLAAEITKQIDAAWAVGDDAGGMDTGAVAADTMYAVWLIKRPDTGVVDALFSLSFTAPTMPTNYTKKRLIGAIRTQLGAANIIAYLQSGDYFRYMSEQPVDVSDSTITSLTLETGTLSVPPSALAHIYGHLSNAGGDVNDSRLWIITKGATEALTNINGWLLSITATTTSQLTMAGQVLADSNSQVEYAAREVSGTATVSIITLGFTMLSRSNP